MKYEIVDIDIKPCDADKTYSDYIYKLDKTITLSGDIKRLNSFNLIGTKLVYTIPYNITIYTILDGCLHKTIEIKQGIYSEVDLRTLLTNNTGIILNPDDNRKFINADTSKLLSIRFAFNQDELISTMLGLDEVSTNISGDLITYNLPVDGRFPNIYNLSIFNHADLKFGFADSNNILTDLSNVQLIPITNKTMHSFEIDAINTPFNQYSNDTDNQSYCFSLPDDLFTIKYIRIRLSSTFNDLPIYNINTLKLRLCFEYN